MSDIETVDVTARTIAVAALILAMLAGFFPRPKR